MLLFALLLLVVGGSQASHFSGTVVTYYLNDTYSDGSLSVIFRAKFNIPNCNTTEYSYKGCANEKVIVSNFVFENAGDTWCQSESITSCLLPDNSPFQFYFDSGNWIVNLNDIGSWRAVADVELRIRSDTNKPNSSPQTTIFPGLRVPSNCSRNINLLTFDPDGDEIKCRYASLSSDECDWPCTPAPVLTLSSICTLSFSSTSSSNQGIYAVQMVMEDFPRQTITLTHTDGSQIVRSTSDRIGTIPIQFALIVDPAAPSCTEGAYLPRFISPTPEHRAHFYIFVDKALEINIRASATNSTITGLLYSGPYNMIKTSSGLGHFSLSWTPSTSEAEQSHPICFVVQASFSSSVYQSELRCVIVTVRIPPKTYLTVVKLNISTTLPLKGNHDKLLKAMKDKLIKNGLPPNITLRLLSNRLAEGSERVAP
ncbi:uncharacterized protein LOC118558495 [Fundulus heteroclitus]|uniref:uncharacterized protein LOC118558495 n=1 Tax=Fundulus heteroclitus TaxID=8078 RepID=UPI00165C0599|nr:uncharacterized protein LOC118558495 [Fundulus heteroclitus]